MIRKWSALLGSLLVLMLSYLVWLEANPEWKRHQQEYFRQRERLARQRYEESLANLNSPQIQKELERLQSEYRKLGSKLEQGELTKLQKQHAGKADDLKTLLDELQKQRSEYRNLEREYLLASSNRRGTLTRRMRGLQKVIDELVERQTKAQAEVDLLASRIQAFRRPLDQLEAAMGRIRRESEDLMSDWLEAQQSQVEVQQLILSDLDRVERCTSCHRSVEDQLMSGAPLPLKPHSGSYLQDHPAERFGCASCHEGQSRATTAAAAHGKVRHWTRPLLGLALTGGMCGRCHENADLQYEPFFEQGKRLFLESGCFGCHDVTGYLTRRKIGPNLSKVGDKVRPDWLERWLSDPNQYLPRTRMPNFRLTRAEIADLSAFLLSLSDGTPRVPFPLAAAPLQDKYDGGRKIFSQSRCVSCHAVNGIGGSLGPDLGKIASKVRPEWLFSFLRDPERRQPGTRMPYYRFDDSQVSALVAYLLQEFQDFDLPNRDGGDAAGARSGGPERGRKLVQKLGCHGCHEIPGFENAPRVGPELTDFGDKSTERLDFGLIQEIPQQWEEWTFAKLLKPEVFRPGLKMPTYNLSKEEAAKLVIFLKSLSRRDDIPPSYRVVESTPPFSLGGEFREIVRRYKCLECHSIRGEGGSLAPDLSFEGSRVQEKWLRQFLRSPYPIRTWMEPRMPQFNLTDREIHTIVNYMKTVLVRDDLIDTPSDREIPALRTKGLHLFKDKKCGSCHQLNFEGGAIGPELDHVAERLTREWLVAWIKDPVSLDAAVREPKFNLRDEEAQALASYLISLGGLNP